MGRRGAAQPTFRNLTAPAVLLATTMLAGFGTAHAAETAAASGAGTQLQEVIVTAQKRSENLQSVPANVQALGTVKLEQLHIQGFNDYIKFLPSVSYQSFGPGYSNVFMRGVAADNQSNHSGPQPTVGTYLDETPITTNGGALDIHVYDIARVEALAGPQGTLYGATSEAGTIRIITNKPEIGKFSAGYDIEGDTVDHGGQGGTIEGFVNIPVTDNAAIRLVGWDEHDAGYIDNVYGTRNFPSTGITINNADLVKKDFNPVDTYGGRAALKIDLNNNWTITPMIQGQDTRDTGTFAYEPGVGDLEVQHFGPDSVHDRWYLASLTVQGKIGDFDLTYNGSYMDRRIDSRADYTDYSFFYDQCCGYAKYFKNSAGAYINPAQEIIGRDHFTKDSHELRISSPAKDRLRFVAGLFYQDQQHYIIQDYQVAGLDPFLSVTGWPGTWWLTDQLRTDRDYAAFGEASFDITPKLTLTAGVRVYQSTSTLEGFYGFGANQSYSSTGEQDGHCAPYAAVAGDPCTDLDGHTSDTGETHKVNLTYHFDSDKLVYFTYSTGFRPGGLNRNSAFGAYRPDYLDNYEVGWKTSWLDNSLRWNGDVYYENWDDFQFSYLGPNSLTIVANAGAARIFGVESDLNWRATEGLTFTAGLAYTNAELTKDFCSSSVTGQCAPGESPDAAKGQQLPVTPLFKGNITARYEWPIGAITAHVQAVGNYQTSSWSDLLTADRQTLGLQQAFATVDLNAGIARDNWTLDLSLLNASDTRAQLYRYDECTVSVCGLTVPGTPRGIYIVPNRPMTFSIRFGQKF
jgi:outer membrane receptor protein involved in Fe transport